MAETTSLTKQDFEILQIIIELIKKNLSYPDEPKSFILNLLEYFFNPTKKRSSLLKYMNKLPNLNLLNQFNIESLASNELILILPIGINKKILITPEGYMKYIKFIINEDEYNILIKIINDTYKKYSYHKLYRFKKEEMLKDKHIAILLFFLLNRSIDENNAYIINEIYDEDIIEKIVNAYLMKNTQIIEYYALTYYLVETKRILGDIAFNKKPKYYLKSKHIDYIILSIKKQTKYDTLFNKKWFNLKNEYKKNLTILRSKNNSHYSLSWEISLDEKLQNKIGE